MHKLLNTALASTLTTSFATVALTDEVAELANLSKSDFLERNEELFVAAVDIQNQLLNRMSPGMGDTAVLLHPVTDTERDAMECMYDTMAARNQIDLLATQMLAVRFLQSKVETDPTFDFVTMTFDEAVREEMILQVPDEAMAAMIECDYIAATQQRLDFTSEVLATIAQEAEARGLGG